MTHRPCPFCGSQNLESIHAEGVYIQCVDCYGEGPSAETETEAWLGWDGKPVDKQKKVEISIWQSESGEYRFDTESFGEYVRVTIEEYAELEQLEKQRRRLNGLLQLLKDRDLASYRK